MKKLILTLLVLVSSKVTGTPSDDFLTSVRQGDYATALTIAKSEADKGESWAQYKLGVMYYAGQGVAQNYPEAMKWYQLAAEQGYALAQYNLGLMYYIGRGTPQDFELSLMWTKLAAAQGDKEAAKNYDTFALRMTTAQIERVQQMARECLGSDAHHIFCE